MDNQDLQYAFTAALPHVFDFTKNAKALLPSFIDPTVTGKADTAVYWAKKAPRYGEGRGIFTAFANNLHLHAFLRSEHVAGKDLKSYKMSFDHRTDTLFGQFLTFGRFRGLRTTDSINAPLHIMLRTIALARLSELAGDMPPEEAATLYENSAPRVKALLQSEPSWDAYLSNVIAFCKLQNHSRWRKVAGANKTCLQSLGALELPSGNQSAPFSNTTEDDFGAIKKDERTKIFQLADDGEWDAVIAHIQDCTSKTTKTRLDYLDLFKPDNIEAVIIADLEANPIKSDIKDLILANFYIQWGYDARGRSGADQVGADNFRLFEERLHKAFALIRPHLEGDVPSHEALLAYLDLRPHIWFEDKPELDKIVEEHRLQSYPDSYFLARRKLHFMVEKWGGSEEAAWQFATELSDRFPEDANLACLPYYAIYEEYLSIEMIQNKKDEARAFIRSEDAKKRLAPYRERILNNADGKLQACYSIPIGWYFWSGQYDEFWRMAQTVGGTYARDGFFGTYVIEEDAKGIESYLINMFART